LQLQEKKEPPQFGEWEKNGVEYTDYFERASKGRNGARKNPNDIKDTNPQEPKVQYAIVRPTTPKHFPDKNNNNNIINDGVGRRATDSPRHHNHRQGDGPKRATRTNTGSDRSFEQSPLHAQARVARGGGGAVSSPSWERKGGGSTESSGHGGVVGPTTPGRSRLRASVETSDDGGDTVPKFGDWDESDPSAAEGYTQVFEKIRDAKNSAGNLASTPTGSSNALKRGSANDTSKGCFCFPWGRK
jgi:RPM1-interacting protein 4